MKQKNTKKLNLDNTAKKIENISNKVDIIMRNRLFVALFLIVDGITFILNPDTTLPEMARNIIVLILIATISVLITNLTVKKKDAKTIIISILIILAGIFFYIYPDLIAAYMQLLLALFIIYNGAMNIANILHSNRLSKYAKALTKKYNKIFDSKPAESKEKKAQREKFKEIDNTINVGLEEQKEKLVAPLRSIINKTSKRSTLYIITNAISIILGIILLIFPDVSMMVWGIIFLYTGIPNLLVAIKSMNLTKKIKEKKFKEILFDTDNNKRKQGEKRKQNGKRISK